MREIKFREWDTERKTLAYGEREDYDDSVGFRFAHEEGGERILMDYIGLKDCTEREIYEGDIVEFKLKKGLNQKGLVVYSESKAAFMIRPMIGKMIYFEKVHELEVIGNIFEDPELFPRINSNQENS